MTFRTLVLTSILAGALAALPASAAGAVRHAAENGSGTACTAAAPCSLVQALTGAGNGVDEVRVHAGTHQLPSGGGGAGGRFAIAGAPGEAMPTLETQAPAGGCGLSVGAGSVVRRLRIRPIATGSRALCTYGQAVVDQIVITGTHADLVGLHLDMGEWTRVDNVSIHLPTAGSRGIVVEDSRSVQLDNVSARVAAAALFVRGEFRASSVQARNSLLDGGANAVQIDCLSVTAFTIVSARHSALGAVDEGDCAFSESDTNLGLAGVNVAPDARGVLRPGPGSTLIDRGSIDAETNDRDVDGDPRTLGGKVDVGADEVPHAPIRSATVVADLTADGVTLSGVAMGYGAERLEARFELGTTPAFGRVVEAELLPPAPGRPFSFPAARVRVDGLAPATTYHVRFVLRNEWGQQSIGPERVFTTDAAPVPPVAGGGSGTGGGNGGGAAPSGGSAVSNGSPAGTGLAGGGGADAPAGSRGEAQPGAGPANAAPSCRVRVVRGRRAGRVVLRGRCSERATLKLAVSRKGRRAVTRSVVVPGGRRFSKRLRLGRLATLRRPLTVTARDRAGAVARPLALRIVSGARRVS